MGKAAESLTGADRAAANGQGLLSFSTRTNVLYDVQALDDWSAGSWVNIATNIVGTGGGVTNLDTSASATAQPFCRLRLHF